MKKLLMLLAVLAMAFVYVGCDDPVSETPKILTFQNSDGSPMGEIELNPHKVAVDSLGIVGTWNGHIFTTNTSGILFDSWVNITLSLLFDITKSGNTYTLTEKEIEIN